VEGRESHQNQHFFSKPTKTFKSMNTDQLYQLKSKYCEYIIDGMDMDCLIQMCYDLLMNEYEKCSDEGIKQEILDLYDQEVLEELTNS
jgi:hypothetical protein